MDETSFECENCGALISEGEVIYRRNNIVWCQSCDDQDPFDEVEDDDQDKPSK